MPSPKGTRTRYPEAFKAEIVARALAAQASGKESLTAIAKEKGVDLSSLSHWVQKEKLHQSHKARAQKRLATMATNRAAPSPTEPPSNGAPAALSTLPGDGFEAYLRRLVREIVRDEMLSAFKERNT
jgi:transposase-like protein